MRRVSLLVILLFIRELTFGLGDEDEDEEPYPIEDDDADAYGGIGSVAGSGGDGEDVGPAGERGPSSVYVMEHGFLSVESPEWMPRGTLLLSGAAGRGFEARLSDAKEFVQLKPDLQKTMMGQAASQARYYAVRMYSPENPRRVLQASVPAKILADHFEDWHDILEVTIGAAGVPVSLAYRVRHTLGLSLFDHTQVHLAEPSRAEGPRVLPGTRDSNGGPGGNGDKQQGGQSFLRKYWWVIIIVMLLLSSAGEEPSAGGKGGGRSGGGGSSGGGGGGGRKGN